MSAVRGEARRGVILEAALEIIGTDGPGALTHRAVAARAGLPLAATTYWFASKDELLQAAYRRAADEDIARVREAAAAHADDEDLAGALADLVGTEIGEGRTALIASFAMWLEAARRPELRAIEEEWTTAYVTAVAGLLRRAGSPTPDLDARILTATLDGLVLAVLARDLPGAAARDEIRPLLDRLVHGLTAAGDRP